MSQKKLAEIEDYLLGRIAALDALIQRYADDTHKLPGIRSQLAEAKTTLREVKAIVGGKK